MYSPASGFGKSIPADKRPQLAQSRALLRIKLPASSQRSAHHTFCFSFPCAPPRSGASKRRFRRALFEFRSGAGLCAPPGRVAQPRLLAADRGNPAGAANRGRLLWVTFLGKTRKVTGCGATPRDFAFCQSCFDTASGLLNTNGLCRRANHALGALQNLQ